MEKRDLAVAGNAPTNPGLLEAMRAAAEVSDESRRRAIHAELLGSTPIVPLREEESGAPELRAARGRDGRPIVLAFTDAAALEAWATEPLRFAVMGGTELVRFAMENDAAGLALNPAGPHGGTLTRQELAALAESIALRVDKMDAEAGVTTMTVRDGGELELWPASTVDSELLAALRSALEGHADVVGAWLMEARTPGGSRPAVGLQLAEGVEPLPMIRALGEALRHPTSIDVIPVDGELARRLAQKMTPIRGST